jgi:hypothetical protein
MEGRSFDEEKLATIQANEATGHDNQAEEGEDSGPILSLSLEEDVNRKDQLGFRKEKAAPAPEAFRPGEQQLLQEGKLGESEFSARLRKVVFGSYKGLPACLILIQINFCPKNRSWFRFRKAEVGISFEKDNKDDGDGENEYDGPIVRKFYPERIRGHVQTAAEHYGVKFIAPITSTAGGLSAYCSQHRPKEGLHLIQGDLVGSPETGVRWRIYENEVSRGGIFENPKLCVILRHPKFKFGMSISMKATTYGGLPIVGKGGARITFTPPQTIDPVGSGPTHRELDSKVLPRVDRGSVAMGKHTWAAEDTGISKSVKLDDEDLEQLTHMEADLLGPQGPGVQTNPEAKAT